MQADKYANQYDVQPERLEAKHDEVVKEEHTLWTGSEKCILCGLCVRI